VSAVAVDPTAPKVGDVLSYTTSIAGGNGHVLQIKTTYLYDTEYIIHGWPSEQNQVVLSQELIFKYKDSVLCRKPFPVRDTSVIRFNKKITLSDNIISVAAFITGTKGSFYTIHGYGGCSYCSHYFGYYSLKGQLLFENYWSDRDKFIINIGNEKSVLNHFGVSARRAKIPFAKDITVFPLARSGETSEGYVL
jgi:hypothetical protein